MAVNRIVPNLEAEDPRGSDDFYAGLLGLERAMDLGWIVAFRSPDDPSVQVSLVSKDASSPEDSVISVGVTDVDEVYARARQAGYEIVHPLTDEPWGVRRFFVRDPNGLVVNVVSHRN